MLWKRKTRKNTLAISDSAAVSIRGSVARGADIAAIQYCRAWGRFDSNWTDPGEHILSR
jgi:hypothetical protein